MKKHTTPQSNGSRTAKAATPIMAQSHKRRGNQSGKSKKSRTPKQSSNVPLLLEHFPGRDMERIYLEFFSPNAQRVCVAGTFNAWNPSAMPLENHGDGRWTIALELFRGKHEYKFVVDGYWMDDPLAPAYVSNPFGGLNCVLPV